MKAIIKEGPEAGLKLLDVPIPRAGEGDVLIKVYAASICGTDVHIYKWNDWAKNRIKKFPLILGHEFAGRVIAVGENVSKIKPGDYVSAESHIFCGECPTCVSGKLNLCQSTKIMGVDRDGCFAEFVVLPEKVIWKNSWFFSPDIASFQEPLGNAVYCVSAGDRDSVYKKSVAIFGDGPAGLFAAMVARCYGATPVILAGTEEYRLEIAKKLGADAVNIKHTNPVRYIKYKTNEAGADIVLEMSGDRRAVFNAFETVKKGGRISAFGILADDILPISWNEIVFSGINICGIHGRQIFYSWNEVSNLLEAELIGVRNVITHRFSLARFNEAFELAASKQCGKIVLYPEIRHMAV